MCGKKIRKETKKKEDIEKIKKKKNKERNRRKENIWRKLKRL